LDNKIKEAEKEIEEIKNNMISRKSGLIDITTQNRDKDKLKELAVKVIDIKHRRQFADKPIDIAKELEQLLEIEIIPHIDMVEVEAEEEIEDIKVIVGDSSVDLKINMNKIEDEIIDEEENAIEDETISVEAEEIEEEIEDEKSNDIDEEEIKLEVPPRRGVKVVEQTEIEEDEELSGDDSIITITEEPTPVEEVTEENEVTLEPVVEEVVPTEVEVPIVEETPEVEEVPLTSSTTEDDIITLSNENVEPEDLQTAEETPVVEDSVVETPTIEPIPVEEQELSIGAMFGENSSQTTENNDNIVLDNDLSIELDQYLKDLDLPNS
jgi:hypothetical protein